MNLEALRFAQGGVAKKDFVPALQFFHIQDNRILGYNGNIALSSPIDINIKCRPKALQFIKAIKTCRDPVVALHLTPNNRLSIKSGGFIVYVDCIEDAEYPNVQPEGEFVKLKGNLLENLFALAPFVAEDASRAWARGILFRGKSAFATNNIILIEKWLGTPFPVEINIPDETVWELCRIKEEPIKLQICENSATFHYANDRWLKTSLYSTKWPDVSGILDKPSNQKPFPDDFFLALEDLLPFVGDQNQVYIVKDRVSTNKDLDIGASSKFNGELPTASFNVNQLRLVGQICDTIDLTMYPNACIFYGNDLRGALCGMQL